MLEQTETRMTPVTIHPMEYRAIVAAGFASPEPATVALSNPKKLEARIRELELELEERSRRFESGIHTARIEAREAGRNSERSDHASRVAMATQALTAALEEFATSRDRYLAKVEQEAVRLALAIAARILHREALMDPLLLAGAVRVALGQLADTTEVCLKVPASEHEMWREMLHLMPNLPLRPELVADDALATGECILETRLGGVDLGVRSQLAEIERGFFDLLEHRSQEQRERKDQRRHKGVPGRPYPASESSSQQNPL